MSIGGRNNKVRLKTCDINCINFVNCGSREKPSSEFGCSRLGLEWLANVNLGALLGKGLAIDINTASRNPDSQAPIFEIGCFMSIVKQGSASCAGEFVILLIISVFVAMAEDDDVFID